MNEKQLYKKLEHHRKKLNDLDTSYLVGKISNTEYHKKREALRKQTKKLVEKYELNRYGDVSNIVR